MKPPVVLRVLSRLAVKHPIEEEIFTTPEELFALLSIREITPIYKKDVSFSLC